MPSVILICGTCQAVRYRSRRNDYSVGQKLDLKPEDFLALGDQPPPTQEAPMCGICTRPLVFQLDVEGRLSGDGRPRADLESPRQRYQAALAEGRDPEEALHESMPPRPGEAGQPAVRTLFEVQKDEQIKELKEIPPGDRWLLITTRRVVVVELGG